MLVTGDCSKLSIFQSCCTNCYHKLLILIDSCIFLNPNFQDIKDIGKPAQRMSAPSGQQSCHLFLEGQGHFIVTYSLCGVCPTMPLITALFFDVLCQYLAVVYDKLLHFQLCLAEYL